MLCGEQMGGMRGGDKEQAGHGNTIAVLIKTRIVVRTVTKCFITCET